ncbi:MAG: archaellum operon transcriptional activator EarA family protein [Thermoproteus sp.]
MALYPLIRSLRRSRIRLEILKVLCRTGEPMYPALLARAIGVSYENVVGALRGLGRRYRKEDSLVGLGLVKEVRVGRQYVYVADEDICGKLAELEEFLTFSKK